MHPSHSLSLGISFPYPHHPIHPQSTIFSSQAFRPLSWAFHLLSWAFHPLYIFIPRFSSISLFHTFPSISSSWAFYTHYLLMLFFLPLLSPPPELFTPAISSSWEFYPYYLLIMGFLTSLSSHFELFTPAISLSWSFYPHYLLILSFSSPLSPYPTHFLYLLISSYSSASFFT